MDKIFEYNCQVLNEIFPKRFEGPKQPENYTEYWNDKWAKEYDNSRSDYPGYEGL